MVVLLTCGVEKRGDNLVIKFYMECVNEKYLNVSEEVFKEAIELLFDIIFNPVVEENGFKKEYVESEKNTLRQLIEGKIDNKDQYALIKATETMFNGYPYSIYKYGYVEDLDQMNGANIYNYYKSVLDTSKIDIFISGDVDVAKIDAFLQEKLSTLNERNSSIVKNLEKTKSEVLYEKEIMDLKQAKVVIGLKNVSNIENYKAIGSVYNTVLGGSSNSKLFRNVREKESLAYSIGSMFLSPKKTIFIKGGIELEKIDKALDIIKIQLDDIKNGNVTDAELFDAKKYIVNSLLSINDSQAPLIDYYMSYVILEQEAKTIEEYIDDINKVDINDIKEFGNNLNMDTVYLLTAKNEKENEN